MYSQGELEDDFEGQRGNAFLKYRLITIDLDQKSCVISKRQQKLFQKPVFLDFFLLARNLRQEPVWTNAAPTLGQKEARGTGENNSCSLKQVIPHNCYVFPVLLDVEQDPVSCLKKYQKSSLLNHYLVRIFKTFNFDKSNNICKICQLPVFLPSFSNRCLKVPGLYCTLFKIFFLFMYLYVHKHNRKEVENKYMSFV